MGHSSGANLYCAVKIAERLQAEGRPGSMHTARCPVDVTISANLARSGFHSGPSLSDSIHSQ